MADDRPLDLTLFGATGFTGNLVAKYLAEHAPEGTRIGLAGRSEEKLASVRAGLPAAAAEWPLIVAEKSDPASIKSLAEGTRVVVTTAGTNRPVAVLLNNGAGNFTASDPSAFPGAFRKSNNFWSGLTPELREASPAFLSRHFSNDLEASSAVVAFPVERGVFTRRSGRLEGRDAEVSYFGRAPPFLKLSL